MRLIALGIVMAGLGCSVSDVDAILACFAATPNRVESVIVWLPW